MPRDPELPPVSERPTAGRSWPRTRRTRPPAADPPSGSPPARRTGLRPVRRPTDRHRAARRTGGCARRASTRSLRRPPARPVACGCAGIPCRVSVGQRVQPTLAVDQRPCAGGADLPSRQAQLGQQRGHLRPARDECLRADVQRLAADPLRAQHPTEPVGRVEHRDRRVRPGSDPQPVGRDQTRNPAADNGNTSAFTANAPMPRRR